MRKFILFFQIIIAMVPVVVFAQNKPVTGSVRDLTGALPGASVVEKGLPSNGVITNANGKFSLVLKGKSNIIIVKFIGYIPQEYAFKDGNTADIILQTNNNGLDEVAVVGYGKRSRPTNTGAVSSISAADIRTVPTANVQNALTGKLPGFFSQQASGQPGKDASDFYIRGVSSLNPAGNQPLIIVDDIQYSYDQLQQINVNEIESISILKDASTTAIYGIKGANGVLVVTTRRGKSGAPKVNLRVETGVQAPTKTPTFLDSYHSALLINEAQTNDGIPTTFTQQDLDHFKNGDDPYGHPNVDWYNKIFKKNTYQANTNLDISGGNSALKYFISGGILKQNGLVRDFADPQSLVNTNYYFNRYNFRSNLDLKANKTLDLRLDVTTRFSDLNQPYNENAVGEIYNFTKETPFTAPYLNPNGSYSYAYSSFNPDHLPTLNARLAAGGYQHSRRTDFNFLFGATQKLDALTDGLSLTGRVAYSSIEQFTKQIFNGGGIPAYHYNPTNNQYSLQPGGTYVYSTYVLTGNTDMNSNNYDVQLYANYDHNFSNAHHVTGLLLFNQTSQTYNAQSLLDASLVAVPQKFQGVSGKLGYDYMQKYLLEFNIAYNGTDRFAANHRFGYFPALSIGYNIAKEKFFSDKFPVFSLLKVRASYGLVGSDAAPGNRYVYNQVYKQGGGYYFGETPTGYGTIYEDALSNANVVWERAKKTDIGLDMNLFNDKISATIDYFHDIRYDQLIVPGSVPEILGVGLPAVNIGKTLNHGFDGQISYHSTLGRVQYNVGFVFSYAKNKILFQDEAAPAYPWLAKTGQPIGQQFGYHSLGYYTADDISKITAYKAAHGGSNVGDPIAVPDNGLPLQPGDLKYQDLNGDGQINVFDQRAIGHPNLPNTSLGLSLQAVYKGFSISALFAGSFNYSFAVLGTGIEPFQSQFQPIHEERWTPATAATAQFPRLTTNPTSVNSPTAYFSDYWLINAYYIRLKTIDVGYQLPSKMLPFKINNARIYLSAYNLFTWDNFKKYQQDPEVATNTAGDAYINQRVINIGIQAGF
ncbi:SusC/RagA family TonB-linked outer membrane protein [Mucilaginibacter dorajii]|nr:TonB-dependent receptor [Mucilaginibacter dorajii]MCS3736223.1 TonB-linked SusC/RagA family outer membrane protein [Mucilaginibacter dorajii]